MLGKLSVCLPRTHTVDITIKECINALLGPEMAQQGRFLLHKPADLRSISGPHGGRRELTPRGSAVAFTL